MSGPAAPLAVREVALAQARELARAGRYTEAEELLDGAWDEGEPSAAVLDLRARIHAQRGRLDEADRCWAEAERLAPGDRAIAAGRRRVAALRDGGHAGGGLPGRVLTSRFAGRAGAAVVALLAFVMLADLWADDGEPRPAAVPPTAPPAPAPPSPSASSGAVLAGLRLDGAGVRVRRSPGEIAVTFERGLFRDGATLSPGGRAVLEALGARLRPYGDRVSVTLIGHTDRSAVRPGGEYASNVELGTVRAGVVREVLRASARIPTDRFTVSTLAGMMPPFPDAGSARNRTVSLRVSAAGPR
ncbi:hypothetical protein GCM10023085_06560 [Actinomadura viridis]|uniref:Flagellar motor protein MotB n=1 Tax=Actinomadura viridis TaxID=58110 RepID=A0A931DLG2_9ACTN|nr:hypothetical protein [Actinomadura viridis]MBG6091672.1 flagellar motor protein MotB [Actinomadura viridis]